MLTPPLHVEVIMGDLEMYGTGFLCGELHLPRFAG
jgi:hypothetical protein